MYFLNKIERHYLFYSYFLLQSLVFQFYYLFFFKKKIQLNTNSTCLKKIIAVLHSDPSMRLWTIKIPRHLGFLVIIVSHILKGNLVDWFKPSQNRG